MMIREACGWFKGKQKTNGDSSTELVNTQVRNNTSWVIKKKNRVNGKLTSMLKVRLQRALLFIVYEWDPV